MNRATVAPLALVTLALPAGVAGQGVVQQQLESRVVAMAREGYTRVGEPFTGYTNQGERSTFEVRLEGGHAYQLIGVCDQDCT
ncbi:MAG: hypothetical protein GWN71_14835, partial [Gammaproteobacteria bacterium]|nr:hypothetical protein [Gemmatimonadota bacterium]NIU74805.1 hypothetical protein [Gammaproteobacteria bacterium]